MNAPYADIATFATLCTSRGCPVVYEFGSPGLACGYAAWPPGVYARVVIIEPGEAADHFPEGIGGWVVLAERYNAATDVERSIRSFGLDETAAKDLFFDASHNTSWDAVAATFTRRFE